ncbi:MAG: CRISPR-associated endoribonuclease Cas6 [Victivallaceae bacterium]|nr:CRISPR-associated endoribonuclease Cas6 [Victivallaceae bacterium]
MQIELQLSGSEAGVLSFDYFHELSAAFYAALTRSFPAFARELHDGECRSRIKLFTFSPFSSDPAPRQSPLPDGEPGLRFGSRIWMRYGSIWPELLYHFADALQKEGAITIRGQKFPVLSMQMVPDPEFAPVMTYRPFGQAGVVVCRYNLNGKIVFQMPDDSEPDIPACGELIAGNLRHKLLRLRDLRPDIFENLMTIGGLSADAAAAVPISVEFLPLMKERRFRTKMIHLKGLNVRGFRAPVRITAPEAIQRIIWNSGLGSMNSQGFGLVEQGRD